MKWFISFSIIIISLSLNSCTSEAPVSPDSQKGGITLNIDRANKPANVVEVTAYLTREGYEEISGTLNLLSDTTADITFNDISAGQWHLKVDAADEDSTIVYTGEKNINILAGITTQVYLTLIPTGNGEGNIYIYVTWGVPPNLHWIDFPNNPIFTINQVPFFTLAVSQAQILFDENKYKMWFVNTYYSGHADISYAESIDGFSWQVMSPSPVLTVGNPGSWDSYAVAMGCIIKEEGIYYLYYVGTAGHPLSSMRQIGLATSTDGISWTKYPDPVISANYLEYFLGAHSVIKVGDTYYMYYDSSPENAYLFNVNLATSEDRINWTRYSNNPILFPNQNWENNSIVYPTVVKDGDIFKMFYGNGIQHAIGIAFSSDGITWNKNEANPIFDLSNVHNNWTTKIAYPVAGIFQGQFRIYYTGSDNNGELSLAVTLLQ